MTKTTARPALGAGSLVLMAFAGCSAAALLQSLGPRASIGPGRIAFDGNTPDSTDGGGVVHVIG